MRFRFHLLALLLPLAACGSGNESFYLLDPAPSELRLASRARSVELREVRLPEYAAAPEIATLGVDGAVRSDTEILWADIPASAIANALTRSLGEITGATVAAEPWPLPGYADMRLEVRIDRMLAGADGRFRLVGQYFLSPDGRNLPARSGRFDIAEPILAEGTPALTEAAGRALTELAETIARAMAR